MVNFLCNSWKDSQHWGNPHIFVDAPYRTWQPLKRAVAWDLNITGMVDSLRAKWGLCLCHAEKNNTDILVQFLRSFLCLFDVCISVAIVSGVVCFFSGYHDEETKVLSYKFSRVQVNVLRSPYMPKATLSTIKFLKKKHFTFKLKNSNNIP